MDAAQRTRPNPAPIPWGRYLVGFAVTAASLAFAMTYYDAVPDPMPVHFDAAGEPDSFTAKTVPGFLGMHLLGPGVTMLTGLASAALVTSQARSAAEDTFPARAPEDRARTVGILSRLQKPMATYLVAIAIIVALAVHQSFGAFGDWNLSIWWVLAAIGLLTVWLMVTLSRSVRDAEVENPPASDAERLRWGMFYANPADERVFVDLMGGANLTFNFARPLAWVVLLALLTPAILVLILVGLSS